MQRCIELLRDSTTRLNKPWHCSSKLQHRNFGKIPAIYSLVESGIWLSAVMTKFVEWFNIWGAAAPFAQACSQVSRFGGKIHILKDRCFYCMLETNFSGYNKILGTFPLECLYVATPWQE